MTVENSNNTLNQYPVEQPFKSPLTLTAILVLIPALALYWFLGDTQSMPRAFKIFFGNWISPIILWFFCASFLHLWLKKAKLKKENDQSVLLANTFISSINEDQTIIDNDAHSLHLKTLKISEQNNIPANNLMNTRLSLFLNHNDESVDDTFAIKEREYMKGSFSLSRFMVWAIPIMGFIGTVWGISNGISHFSDAMTSTNSVTDVSAMLKENLPLVTSSLATAFDTTLLALLLSIPLMMLMLTLEKTEEAYLIELDERWYHDIKPLLADVNGNTAASTGTTTTVSSTAQASNDSNNKVAGEIKLLSTQIKALQETMEDLYETIFTSKISASQKDETK
ncbi:hypothetical protein GCM10009133_23690 [Cocleimonas flava]|uniref:MotA/TolQ/ExbB proton channel family protein n=1 Tax=Cocleimonas flava TaxID=634765 RepID=A0A4R1EPI2_9GAMM|nr:MotA/TolQ/ExbB proton channel family protein [Cocleimonas flava]TCJ82903.1 MotA/TolQ/ExbB proton channel family protein [Cocleimonas flava]